MNSNLNNISVLVDFATQINYSDHQYINYSDYQPIENKYYVLTKEKTNINVFFDFVGSIFLKDDSSFNNNQKKQVFASLDMIESHLQNKIRGISGFFIKAKEKEKISRAIDTIQFFKNRLSFIDDKIQTEEEARLKFYKELPRKLKVKKAATGDLEVIKAVSRKIWESTQDYSEYEKKMIMFFEGEHLLFEEGAVEEVGEDFSSVSENYNFCEVLRGPHMGAYLRGSSHYDHGTTNDQTGGPVPTEEEVISGRVKNPQYEIVGPQAKAILFGRVFLALGEDEQPIFGKTYDQTKADLQRQGKKTLPTKGRRYTFMQTEWAPDSESVWTANFWKHRVFSFLLYVGRKITGFRKPNVGPYGYGHADKGRDVFSNPTVVRIRQ